MSEGAIYSVLTTALKTLEEVTNAMKGSCLDTMMLALLQDEMDADTLEVFGNYFYIYVKYRFVHTKVF